MIVHLEGIGVLAEFWRSTLVLTGWTKDSVYIRPIQKLCLLENDLESAKTLTVN